MNSSNWKCKMAGITQKGQKRLIFIVVPQLRIADYTWFLKKIDSKIILQIVIIIMIIQQKP